MKFYNYLTISKNTSKIYHLEHNSHLFKMGTFKSDNYYIYDIYGLARLSISSENFSKIEIINKELVEYDLKKIVDIFDYINRFFSIKFTYFEDKLTVNNMDLNTECFLKLTEHPLEAYGFRGQHPEFPFCQEPELILYKLDEWKEEYPYWRALFLVEKVNRLMELSKKNGMVGLKKYDSIFKDNEMFINDYLQELKDENRINFIKLLTSILYNFKYIHHKYIKLY